MTIKTTLDTTAYKPYKPRYGVVWRDVGVTVSGWAMLVVAVAQLRSVLAWPLFLGVLAVACPLSALFWHRFNLFVHAAGHYELTRSRKWNDILADLFITPWFLASVQNYRLSHFTHHRTLGTTEDTEFAYFYGLSPTNLLLAVSGYFTIGSLRRKRQLAGVGDSTRPVVAFIVWNLACVGVFASSGRYLEYVALYFVPVLFGVPFVAFVRTICEHRLLGAESLDCFTVDHGKYSRNFKTGFWGFFLGAAGFNDHWVHHEWPFLHYTVLAQVRSDLKRRGKPAGPEPQSYATVLVALVARACLKSNSEANRLSSIR